jgi:hypothetical protein
LFYFSDKPNKSIACWKSELCCSSITVFDHLFKIVQWEDEEPTLIADLLKG